MLFNLLYVLIRQMYGNFPNFIYAVFRSEMQHSLSISRSERSLSRSEILESEFALEVISLQVVDI